MDQPNGTGFLDWVGADFRPDLAFPQLTEAAGEAGHEEHVCSSVLERPEGEGNSMSGGHACAASRGGAVVITPKRSGDKAGEIQQ